MMPQLQRQPDERMTLTAMRGIIARRRRDTQASEYVFSKPWKIVFALVPNRGSFGILRGQRSARMNRRDFLKVSGAGATALPHGFLARSLLC
ncbi:MAG: twin-arginine translocation signal domain-containing protein [Verrucomicrobia bacterium]|nr:MAG: twin-arginine translocation signal domain-containing protein [Verrucomicrobiota bacterium]